MMDYYPNSARFILIFLAAFLLSCDQVPAQKSQAALKEKARKADALAERLHKPGSPGGTFAVVYNNTLMHAGAFGEANLEYGIANSPQTVYHIASISKQFTVFAVLLLQQKGKLSIDDDIRKFIEELPDYGYPITLRHLANHTSGLRDQWNLLAMAGWRLDDVITKDHILTFAGRQNELNFTPGERYLYSNTGYTLLAEVVERVSGMSFRDFSQNYIFEPLGMANTFFYDDHEEIVPNRAYSYYSDGNSYKKRVLSYANAGATSLFTTVEDLSLWAVFLNDPDEEYASIVRLMNEEATLNNGESFGGALGQFVDEHKGLHRIQHGGADAGYRTFLGRFPDEDTAVIVFSNYAFFNAGRLAMQLADIYLDEKTADYKPTPLFSESEFLMPDPETLGQFEGYYVNHYDLTVRRFLVDEGALVMDAGSFQVKLNQVGEGLFYFPVMENTIRFSEQSGNMTAKIGPSQTPSTFIREVPVRYTQEQLNRYSGTYVSEELQTAYTIEVKNGALTASHVRTGEIVLSPVSQHLFRGDQWYFNRVEFEMNDGTVTGMRASGSRAQNVFFEKVD